jgi:lipopolysaccharide/colanic/teichoic acid biosynthesis glycosyltransferase
VAPAGEAVWVGAVGRLVAEKGYRELIAAAERVRTAHPEVVFLAVGMADPAKDDALGEDEIRRASRHVTFTGWRGDVAGLLAAMDVFVLASWREGLPRSAVEAAASGLPMVLTDIRGCREVGRHGTEALLVPPRDPDALTEAILRLVEDADLRKSLGRAARLRAEERFDQRRVADLVVSEYRRLLTGPPNKRTVPARAPARRRRVQGAVKRSADVVVSAAALAGLSPVMGIVALVVRRSMGSPVLFRQTRLGRDGEPFTLYKFRTMRDALGPDGVPLPDGDRLTKVGGFLRRTSLDELPELWNVLRGEMSLVGPRPLLPQYRGRYSPEQWRRHEVRPGLAGPVAARGRNALSWEQKMALDVDYVDRWSLRLDARILVASLWSTVRMRGIAADGHATMPEFLPQPGECQ